MQAEAWFTLLIGVPLIAAVVSLFFSARNPVLAKGLEFTALAISLVGSVLLLWGAEEFDLLFFDSGALAIHLQNDGFRALFAVLTGFLWLVSSIFAREYLPDDERSGRYRFCHLLTFAAVLGLFFSGDFRTTLIFFEIASLASYAYVAHEESPAALRAAATYLTIAIAGGLAILVGMMLLQQRLGTLEFKALRELTLHLPDKSTLYLPGALMMVGYASKAGIFPLHFWLPKAHPVAPAPASALLSGILTKTGIFGVAAISLCLFPHDQGWSLALLVLAALTMLWGALTALLALDLKAVFACSSVSQLGFILLGIALLGLLGYHDGVAVRGVILHMLNHSLVKLLLFSLAGVIYLNLHELSLDRIRGYGRGKPLLLALFLSAALSLCGVPLFAGYLSKTLLHESIVEASHLFHGFSLERGLEVLELLFLFCGALTVAYIAKVGSMLFLDHGPGEGRQLRLSRPTLVVLCLTALLLPLLGILTDQTDTLADLGQGFFLAHAPTDIPPYFAGINLRAAAISLLGGVALHFGLRHLSRQEADNPTQLSGVVSRLRQMDADDRLYRPLLVWLTRVLIPPPREFSPPAPLLTRPYELVNEGGPSDQVAPTANMFSLDLLLLTIGIAIILGFVLTAYFVR